MSSGVPPSNHSHYGTEEISQSYTTQTGRIAVRGAIQGYQWTTDPYGSAFNTGSDVYGVRDTLDELTFYDMRERREDTYKSQEAFYEKIEDALDRLKRKDETEYAKVSEEYQEYRQYVEEKQNAEEGINAAPQETNASSNEQCSFM